MADEWRYRKNEQQFGPVSLAELKRLAASGELTRNDLVMRNGMPGWAQAGKVPGLFAANASPPSRPTSDAIARPPATSLGSGDWYYQQNGQTIGPVTLSVLQQMCRAGSVTHSDRVRQGQGNWQAAANVAQLMRLASKPSLFDKLSQLGDLVRKGCQVFELRKAIFVAFSSFSFISALVGDFLRPLGPINFAVLLVSSVVVLSLAIWLVRSGAAVTRFVAAFAMLFFSIAVCFGMWWALAFFYGGAARGFLAENLGFVGDLQSSVLGERKVNGSQLADDVREKIRLETDAKELIRFALRGYLEDVVKADVVGEFPGRRKSSSHPDEVIIEYNLEVAVNESAFETQIEEKMLPILEKVSRSRGEFFVSAKPARYWLYDIEILPRDGTKVQDPSGSFEFVDDGTDAEFGKHWVKGVDPELEMVFIINSERNGAFDRNTWQWFHVPDISRDNQLGSVALRIDIQFLDEDDDIVNRDQVVVSGAALPGISLRSYGQYRAPEICLSPYLIASSSHYARTIRLTRELRFQLDELEKTKTIRCVVSRAEK